LQHRPLQRRSGPSPFEFALAQLSGNLVRKQKQQATTTSTEEKLNKNRTNTALHAIGAPKAFAEQGPDQGLEQGPRNDL